MKVLMLARDTLYTSPGGDTIQILSTAKYLKRLGLELDVKLSSEKVDYNKYSLLHFFNIIRPDDILNHIKNANIPFVVSTIFVDYSEFEKKNRRGLFGLLTKTFSGDQIEYIKSIARYIKNGDKIKSSFYLLHGQRASILKIAGEASMLLPNSDSEYKRFNLQYNTNTSYKKVPNAIDVDTFNLNAVADETYRDHVICVGRIEGRKNQLNLIKALVGTDLKLTLVGKPSPNHIDYFEDCKRLVAANSNMQIIEHVSQAELARIYKSAKVHVLPSWFETTGLSSLEAALMGCNIVVTPKGDTEEYFKNLAYYCDPDNINSIKQAVISAFEDPYNSELGKLILLRYTWQQAAEATLEAYQTVINKHISVNSHG